MIDRAQSACWPNIKLTLGQRLLFVETAVVSQQPSEHVDPVLVQYWVSIAEGGSALHQHRINVFCLLFNREVIEVIYHPLYGMNNYVLIWGDWLSCDPLRGSHDSQSPHIRKHLCPILWQL